jgi:RNA 3'-terminal phosphate cyclase (ATP)
MGPAIEATLDRAGFYPVGGGEMTVRVTPADKLRGFDLLDTGELRTRRVQALVSKLPSHIGHRECQTIAAASGWPESCFAVTQVPDSRGPGNVVMIELVQENLTELFTGFGAKGVRAEEVALQAWDEAREYLASGVPVGPHLADQLLLPLAFSAQQGHAVSFRTMALTDHSLTQIDILRQFLDIGIRIEERAAQDVVIHLSPSITASAGG